MLCSFGIRALPNLHRKFLARGFQNSISLLHNGLGRDTLWVGFGLSVGMCGLHNVCCCCNGKMQLGYLPACQLRQAGKRKARSLSAGARLDPDCYRDG